jgi:quercetin dioxygenase-like cupin family protein
VHCPRKLTSAAVLAALLVLGAACGDDDSPTTSTTSSSGTESSITTTTAAELVVRDDLAFAQPTNSPGQELYLARVTIQPGGEIATHFHEGTQIANIEAGTLTYTVVSGTVQVTRADGTVEAVTGPDEIALQTGDALTENRDMIHSAANHGDTPVVILLAALLAEGAPPSTPVEG